MPRLIPSLLVAVSSVIALAGCAPTASIERAESAAPVRQCVFQDQIQSFRVHDEAIYVRGAGKAVFQLQAASYCPDLDSAIALAFLPQGGQTSLCTGDWTQVVPSGAVRPFTPCRVRVVKRLSQAEVAALPERDRP